MIREALVAAWNKHVYAGAVRSRDELSGSSPPSVFVGSYGYPRVGVGPLVPANHGDTGLLDDPERWGSKTLREIIGYRLGLVRGVMNVRANDTSGRYIESLQEMAMSSRPADAELCFERGVDPPGVPDGHATPFGPTGRIRSASFSRVPPHRALERAYGDDDMDAREAILSLYRAGIDVTRIQKCLSVGMFGVRRRLVPTKWSITAVDAVISRSLALDAMESCEIDSWRVFDSERLGNAYSVILYPHAWRYEMVEAWYLRNGTVGFGSDSEGHAGIGHPPAIAGAYFAARLGVAEYLARSGVQAGALVLREIRPEYSIPVGVWQVREGIRDAMRGPYKTASGMDEAIIMASSRMSTSAAEWISHGDTARALKQRSLSEYI